MKSEIEKLLLISGPVGVGKTTVANELSTLLEVDGIAHTFVDLDALTYTFPRSASDAFGDILALENLTAVWGNCRRRGSKNLIIPRVVESRDYAMRISDAVSIPNPVICRLTASSQTLLDRVRIREIGSNLAWHEKRSLQLSNTLDKSGIEDFCVSTDQRTIKEIAEEMLQEVNWSQ